MKIGSNAFASNQLTSLTIPNSVTRIEGNAFAGNKLTSVTIPDGVTHLGSTAFKDNQLTHVALPKTLKSVGFSTFHNNQIRHIAIPAAVELADKSEEGTTDRAVSITSFIGSQGSPVALARPDCGPTDSEVDEQVRGRWAVQVFSVNPLHKDEVRLEEQAIRHNWGDRPLSAQPGAGLAGAFRTRSCSGYPVSKRKIPYGAAVVNPAAARLRFVDKQGKELAPAIDKVGTNPDGTPITDYSFTSLGLAAYDPQNYPIGEPPAELAGDPRDEWYNARLKEKQQKQKEAKEKAAAPFYQRTVSFLRIGDRFRYHAPRSLRGLTTDQAEHEMILSAAIDGESGVIPAMHNFVYDVPSGTQSDGANNMAQQRRPAGVERSTTALADTGTSLATIAMSSLGLLIFGAIIIARHPA